MKNKHLRLCLVGYGKMGHVIEDVALKKGHSIISRISKSDIDAHFQTIFDASVVNSDVCIEFSHPNQVIENIKKLAVLKKQMVIGTTGWDKHIEEIRALVKKENIGLIYSPNFSIGVNFFFSLVKHLAEGCDFLTDYDIAALEIHHSKKADSPSGTALKMTKILLENIERKTEALYGNSDGKIATSQLQVNTIRCGNFPGTHQVILDSEDDTITLSHNARSKKGFASGAIKAAEWIKDRKGFYTLDDMLKEQFNSTVV